MLCSFEKKLPILSQGEIKLVVIVVVAMPQLATSISCTKHVSPVSECTFLQYIARCGKNRKIQNAFDLFTATVNSALSFHFRILVALADVLPVPQGTQAATEHLETQEPQEIQEHQEIMAYRGQSAKLV